MWHFNIHFFMIVMEMIAMVGISAGTMSILGYMPQIIKSQKLKSMKELSFLLLLLFVSASFLWMVYGFYRTDLILGILSTITFSMGSALIVMKFSYERKFQSYYSVLVELRNKKSHRTIFS